MFRKSILPIALAISLAITGLTGCGNNNAASNSASGASGASSGANNVSFDWQPEIVLKEDDALLFGSSVVYRWQEIQKELSDNPIPGINSAGIGDFSLFLDPQLQIGIPTANERHNGDKVVIYPGRHYDSGDQNRILFEDGSVRFGPEVLSNESWGVFPTYYMLQRTARNGKLLDRPLVTPIRIEGRELYEPPSFNYVDGRVLVTLPELGDGVEGILIGKVQSYIDTTVGSEQVHTAFWGFHPEAEEMVDNTIDISRFDSSSSISKDEIADKGVFSANTFMRLYKSDARDFLSVEVAALKDSFFGNSRTHMFFMVKKNGKWVASQTRNIDDFALRIPIRLTDDPTGAVPNVDDWRMGNIPNTMTALAADGQLRQFPITFKNVNYGTSRNGQTPIHGYAFVRGSMLAREFYLSVPDDDGQSLAELEKELNAINDYSPPVDYAVLDTSTPEALDGWLEAAPKKVSVSADVFGTMPASRFIAANLMAGYNEISLADYPEIATRGQVFEVVHEAIKQNPLTLTPGDGAPDFWFDSDEQVLKIKIDIEDVGSRDEYVAMQNQVRARVSEIVDEIIDKGMSDEDKALAINDWLVDNVEYDQRYTDDYGQLPDEYDPNLPPEESLAMLIESLSRRSLLRGGPTTPEATAYGALFNGKAICSGYSYAFSALAREAGLESVQISGTVGSDGHMWNKVYLDGKWKNYDATWNDSDTRRNEFIGLDDSEIQSKGERTIEWSNTFPLLNSQQFHY
ncbi:MAG: transglutaminase-like domain-containing protein [Actinomycetaceae bacterium]|nr:transglutaminase-like domain-containing protein [Actinomycetaceae bacterium]